MAAVEFHKLSRDELFTQFAQDAARITVVTPNRRLAQHLKREFDRAQAARGVAFWESADILPFSAWVERSFDALLYSGRGAHLPVLLGSAQEQALWEGIVRDSPAGQSLLAVADTAALAREAWQLAHAWHITPNADAEGNEDVKAFAGWARRFQRTSAAARQTDGARLADLVRERCAEIKLPQCLVAYGFETTTPQQSELLRAIADSGCDVRSAAREPSSGGVQRIACVDARDEIARAAAWARARLEAEPQARIGIVVPDLARRRSAIMRVFSATLAPAYALPGEPRRTLPFNVSLGASLGSYPLVAAALLILELASREVEFESASRLLRLPFIGGAESELAPRARLDAELRRRAEPTTTLERLIALMRRSGAGCPLLDERLGALAELRRARLFGAKPPSQMIRAMSDALIAVGFPGERGLDSGEYQTLKKWHELLAEFATLDRVIARIDYAGALARLRRMATDTLFQPESPEVPIQILGVLEAAGIEFDHLWVMGLDDETWPPAPRPNPFLPLALQRAAGVPQASAVAALEFARRLTHGWLQAATEVVLSHPRREQDRELEPSPLLAGIAEQSLALPDYPSYRDSVHRARRIVRESDEQAPPLPQAAGGHGGTAIIRDHAACPFRSLALHRLGARSIETPHTGLDALERGSLLHSVLAQVWDGLKNKRTLDAIGATELEALLGRSAQHALARLMRDRPSLLDGRFGAIEARRLAALARDWLDAERTRADFDVVATEAKCAVEIGGLEFNARLDRVDALPDGRRIVIDYKTGNAPPLGALLGERPEEPQLPIYLTAVERDARALAFAQVKTGEMQFTALARDADMLAGAKTLPDAQLKNAQASWDAQVVAWRDELARLARSFAAGDARVDPKNYPETCRLCDVRPFCRIYERMDDRPVEDDDA